MFGTTYPLSDDFIAVINRVARQFAVGSHEIRTLKVTGLNLLVIAADIRRLCRHDVVKFGRVVAAIGMKVTYGIAHFLKICFERVLARLTKKTMHDDRRHNDDEDDDDQQIDAGETFVPARGHSDHLLDSDLDTFLETRKAYRRFTTSLFVSSALDTLE